MRISEVFLLNLIICSNLNVFFIAKLLAYNWLNKHPTLNDKNIAKVASDFVVLRLFVTIFRKKVEYKMEEIRINIGINV